MRILLIDNYDSFTFNLVHLVEKCFSGDVEVRRNDAISLSDVSFYDKIILSPGPGLPDDAGITKDVIREFSASKSILGVCLGMQAIAEVYGAGLKNPEQVHHGIASPISITKKDKLFANCTDKFLVGRYHSWAIKNDTLPESLEVLAVDEHQTIMAIRHKTFDVCGVQFHPESILSEYGEQLMKNWLG